MCSQVYSKWHKPENKSPKRTGNLLLLECNFMGPTQHSKWQGTMAITSITIWSAIHSSSMRYRVYPLHWQVSLVHSTLCIRLRQVVWHWITCKAHGRHGAKHNTVPCPVVQRCPLMWYVMMHRRQIDLTLLCLFYLLGVSKCAEMERRDAIESKRGREVTKIFAQGKPSQHFVNLSYA